MRAKAQDATTDYSYSFLVSHEDNRPHACGMIPIQIHSAETMKQSEQIAKVMVRFFRHDQYRSVNQVIENNSADIQAICDRNPKRFTSKYTMENVVGKFSYFPLRIVPNFLIDNKDFFIPMAIEEPSVVAAASYAAILARDGGGFETEYSGSIMIGQIQLT